MYTVTKTNPWYLPSKQWREASVNKTANAVCIEDGGVMSWGVRRRNNKTCGVGRRWWPTMPRTYFGRFSRHSGHDWRGPAICRLLPRQRGSILRNRNCLNSLGNSRQFQRRCRDCPWEFLGLPNDGGGFGGVYSQIWFPRRFTPKALPARLISSPIMFTPSWLSAGVRMEGKYT